LRSKIYIENRPYDSNSTGSIFISKELLVDSFVCLFFADHTNGICSFEEFDLSRVNEIRH